MSSIYDLDINPEVIHEDNTTYQSLLDENNVDLFSNEHMKQKEQYEQQVKVQENQVLQGLFVNQSDQIDTNDLYDGLLFQEPMVINNKMDYQNNTDKSKEIMIIGSILLIILFLSVMVRYFRRARKKLEEAYE